MSKQKKPTEEQMDYLGEMMNIGAGNAATALSQLLNCQVELNLPMVHLLPSAEEVASIMAGSAETIVCVRMQMLGDITGQVLFVVSHEHQRALVKFLKTNFPKNLTKLIRVDTTIIEEIANVITGVFLTALHDFSQVSICHTVPVMTVETIRTLVEECTSSLGPREILVIESEFIVKQAEVKTILFLIPVLKSLDTLIASIDAARAGIGAA